MFVKTTKVLRLEERKRLTDVPPDVTLAVDTFYNVTYCKSLISVKSYFCFFLF